MNSEQLEDLRTKVLGDIVPLVVATSDVADKFDVIIRLIQSGRGTTELYAQAYEAAKAITDEAQRLDALMVLLDEIEAGLEGQSTAEEIHTNDESHNQNENFEEHN